MMHDNTLVYNFRPSCSATEYQLATGLVSQNGNVAVYIVLISSPLTLFFLKPVFFVFSFFASFVSLR